MKTALITGITGQDGAYLAQNLLDKGYKVFGAFRRTSARNFWRIRDLGIDQNPNLHLVEHDLTDLASNIDVLNQVKPVEIYNLAAQSFVHASFQQPSATAKITALGTLNLLEAIRLTNSQAKFYQASTSEMFGLVQEVPQTESTSFYPRSPYGVSKLFAHWATVNYRESYGIFGASGILFNHESPLRGREFVTRKITTSIARISQGSSEILSLGNLDAERDWGFAKEYVEGMWRMLQADIPDTYVLATNKRNSVREFLRLSCQSANLEVVFEGSGENEIGRDSKSGKIIVAVDSKYYRPAEVDLLIGDPSKAKKILDWEPQVSLEQLSQMMVESDINKIKAGRQED